MAIYQLFLQHIIYSLADTGKAAVVVPTGFLTAKAGIDKKIRKRLINENWLTGAISMPANIFANTPTSVSVLFIDKSRTDEQSSVFLIDASNLGSKVKENGNQRTALSYDEEQQIINSFVNQKVIGDFSISVKLSDIKERNYNLSAGQYFPVKIKYVELTPEEFMTKMNSYQEELGKLFAEGSELEDAIKKSFGEVKYE